MIPSFSFTRVQGGAKDDSYNNDNLQAQWDLSGFSPSDFMCVLYND